MLLAGCGGSSDPAPATPTPVVGSDEQSVAAVEEQLAELTRRKDAARRAGDEEEVERLEQAMQEIERAQDAALEEEAALDPAYERALDRLPLHEPPLHVAQLVVDDSHELVVRVKEHGFFCGNPAEKRLAAVRSYYEAARAEMEAAGVTDFTMIVDGLRETNVIKPLARASGENVALTKRGRGAGPCRW